MHQYTVNEMDALAFRAGLVGAVGRIGRSARPGPGRRRRQRRRPVRSFLRQVTWV